MIESSEQFRTSILRAKVHPPIDEVPRVCTITDPHRQIGSFVVSLLSAQIFKALSVFDIVMRDSQSVFLFKPSIGGVSGDGPFIPKFSGRTTLNMPVTYVQPKDLMAKLETLDIARPLACSGAAKVWEGYGHFSYLVFTDDRDPLVSVAASIDSNDAKGVAEWHVPSETS